MSRDDFEAWLTKNHEHLMDYAPDEVARLALHCGFTMADVAPSCSDWVSQSRRKLLLWESPFFGKWLRASLAQQGKDFEP